MAMDAACCYEDIISLTSLINILKGEKEKKKKKSKSEKSAGKFLSLTELKGNSMTITERV